MTTIAQKVREVPGVTEAALMAQDGTLQADAGRTGDALAAKAIYLTSMITGPLGEAFDLGELQTASIHSAGNQFLMFHSRDKYLSVSVKPDISLDSVEIGIRKVLALRQTGQ